MVVTETGCFQEDFTLLRGIIQYFDSLLGLETTWVDGNHMK